VFIVLDFYSESGFGDFLDSAIDHPYFYWTAVYIVYQNLAFLRVHCAFVKHETQG
jgi:hypothetical protein